MNKLFEYTCNNKIFWCLNVKIYKYKLRAVFTIYCTCLETLGLNNRIKILIGKSTKTHFFTKWSNIKKGSIPTKVDLFRFSLLSWVAFLRLFPCVKHVKAVNGESLMQHLRQRLSIHILPLATSESIVRSTCAVWWCPAPSATIITLCQQNPKPIPFT